MKKLVIVAVACALLFVLKVVWDSTHGLLNGLLGLFITILLAGG